MGQDKEPACLSLTPPLAIASPQPNTTPSTSELPKAMVTEHLIENTIEKTLASPDKYNETDITPSKKEQTVPLPVLGKEKAKKFLKALGSQNKYVKEHQNIVMPQKEQRKKEKKTLTPHEKAQETIDEIEALKKHGDRTVPCAYFNEHMIHHITADQSEVFSGNSRIESIASQTVLQHHKVKNHSTINTDKRSATDVILSKSSKRPKIASLEAIKAYDNNDKQSDDDIGLLNKLLQPSARTTAGTSATSITPGTKTESIEKRRKTLPAAFNLIDKKRSRRSKDDKNNEKKSRKYRKARKDRKRDTVQQLRLSDGRSSSQSGTRSISGAGLGTATKKHSANENNIRKTNPFAIERLRNERLDYTGTGYKLTRTLPVIRYMESRNWTSFNTDLLSLSKRLAEKRNKRKRKKEFRSLDQETKSKREKTKRKSKRSKKSSEKSERKRIKSKSGKDDGSLLAKSAKKGNKNSVPTATSCTTLVDDGSIPLIKHKEFVDIIKDDDRSPDTDEYMSNWDIWEDEISNGSFGKIRCLDTIPLRLNVPKQDRSIPILQAVETTVKTESEVVNNDQVYCSVNNKDNNESVENLDQKKNDEIKTPTVVESRDDQALDNELEPDTSEETKQSETSTIDMFEVDGIEKQQQPPPLSLDILEEKVPTPIVVIDICDQEFKKEFPAEMVAKSTEQSIDKLYDTYEQFIMSCLPDEDIKLLDTNVSSEQNEEVLNLNVITTDQLSDVLDESFTSNDGEDKLEELKKNLEQKLNEIDENDGENISFDGLLNSSKENQKFLDKISSLLSPLCMYNSKCSTSSSSSSSSSSTSTSSSSSSIRKKRISKKKKKKRKRKSKSKPNKWDENPAHSDDELLSKVEQLKQHFLEKRKAKANKRKYNFPVVDWEDSGSSVYGMDKKQLKQHNDADGIPVPEKRSAISLHITKNKLTPLKILDDSDFTEKLSLEVSAMQPSNEDEAARVKETNKLLIERVIEPEVGIISSTNSNSLASEIINTKVTRSCIGMYPNIEKLRPPPIRIYSMANIDLTVSSQKPPKNKNEMQCYLNGVSLLQCDSSTSQDHSDTVDSETPPQREKATTKKDQRPQALPEGDITNVTAKHRSPDRRDKIETKRPPRTPPPQARDVDRHSRQSTRSPHRSRSPRRKKSPHPRIRSPKKRSSSYDKRSRTRKCRSRSPWESSGGGSYSPRHNSLSPRRSPRRIRCSLSPRRRKHSLSPIVRSGPRTPPPPIEETEIAHDKSWTQNKIDSTYSYNRQFDTTNYPSGGYKLFSHSFEETTSSSWTSNQSYPGYVYSSEGGSDRPQSPKHDIQTDQTIYPYQNDSYTDFAGYPDEMHNKISTIPVLGSQDNGFYFHHAIDSNIHQHQQLPPKQPPRTFSNLIEIHQSPLEPTVRQQQFVVRKGNVLEIVPKNDDPCPVSIAAVAAAPKSNRTKSTVVAVVLPTTGGSSSTTTTSAISLTPTVLTREEIERQEQKKQELKIKKKQELDKKRLDRFMRKEKLKLEIKHLLELDAQLMDKKAVPMTRSVYNPNAVRGKSILRPKNTICGKKYVRFADGVVPGDGTSDGADDLITIMPLRDRTKRMIKKKLDMKRRRAHKKENILCMQIKSEFMNTLNDIKPFVDPELENMPPPPPPTGNPPAHLQQPKLRMIFESIPKLIYFHYNKTEHSMYVSPYPTSVHINQPVPQAPSQNTPKPISPVYQKQRQEIPKVFFVQPPQFIATELPPLPLSLGPIFPPPPPNPSRPPSPSTPYPRCMGSPPIGSHGFHSMQQLKPLMSIKTNPIFSPRLPSAISPQTFHRLTNRSPHPILLPNQQQLSQWDVQPPIFATAPNTIGSPQRLAQPWKSVHPRKVMRAVRPMQQLIHKPHQSYDTMTMPPRRLFWYSVDSQPPRLCAPLQQAPVTSMPCPQMDHRTNFVQAPMGAVNPSVHHLPTPAMWADSNVQPPFKRTPPMALPYQPDVYPNAPIYDNSHKFSKRPSAPTTPTINRYN